MLDSVGGFGRLLHADNELPTGIKMLLKSKIILRVVKNILEIYRTL